MSSADEKKKKKKREDDFMKYILQFMEKSMKACLDQAIDEICKDLGGK